MLIINNTYFKLCLITLFIYSCSQNISKNNNTFFEKSALQFSIEFPQTWPPKPLPIKLNKKQIEILKNITLATSMKLSSMGIEHIQTSPFSLKVTPSKNSFLNITALDLTNLNLSLAYDSLYFAKNPFSAGTFEINKKELIFSHINLNSEKKLMNLISHENIHVDTYIKFVKKEFSIFHCKFKGEQFAPHYLSCDEMNAYKNDIDKLIKNESDSNSVSTKIKHAKRHTESIPTLINSLILSSIKIEGENIIIYGENENGMFWIEFPKFNLQTNLNLRDAVMTHLNEITMQALNTMAFYSKLEED